VAKSKPMQWLPSGGVLVVAIGAGLVAAILINVYLNVVRSGYEAGAKSVLQMAEEVEQGTPLQPRHLKIVMLPKPFVADMKQAVDAKAKDNPVIGKKAPRHLYPGEFLFYPDFLRRQALVPLYEVPRGFELITIPLITGDTLGAQLQPGSYVNVYGDFNISSDPRRQDIQVLPVIETVEVKLIQGSAEAVTEKSHSYGNISVQVRKDQAQQLLQIQKALASRSFHVTVAPRPEGSESMAPEISRPVLDLVEKGKPPPLGLVP